MPTTIYVDDHAKKVLDDVKSLLKSKGMFGQSYGDAIRYLYRIAKKNIDDEVRGLQKEKVKAEG